MSAAPRQSMPPSMAPTTAPTMLASPASVDLNQGLEYLPTPAPIIVSDPAGLGTGITVVNPALGSIGVSVSTTSPTTAVVSLLGVGSGVNANMQITDGRGAAAQIAVQTPQCGRPALVNFVELLAPASGSKNVPTTTPALSFAAGTNINLNGPFTPGGKLHFVVNASSTVDPPTILQAATPPPNVPTPSPSPGETYAYLSGPPPQLLAGTKYDVYYYDDACNGDILAGSFST